MFKTTIEPKEIIAALADRQGKCHWLVFQITPNRVGAVTGHTENMMQSLKTAACSAQNNGGAILTRMLQADGYVLCTERAATVEGVNALIEEARLAPPMLLQLQSIGKMLEKGEMMPVQVMAATIANAGRMRPMEPEDFASPDHQDDADNSDAPRG